MACRSFFLTLWILFSLYLQAQSPNYPRNYFSSPLGRPISLAANFGELRPNHWHMGLDIRTDAKENLPVYAAADGYISHIGVRPQSFGRFIIIQHPNGMSTLYGHLNDFFPGLEDYVTAKQYEKQSWAIELDFDKKQFPVTKGSFIAYSGNTGGSQGPHLHFEIYDTRTERRFNPLLFGFGLTDETAPAISRLAVYDRSRSVYDQSPQFISIKKTDSGYIIPKNQVWKTGMKKISFAVQAFDKMSASGSVDGIYSAKMVVDDQPLSGFVLDSITYEETVCIEAQIDHQFRYNGGSFLQQLSPLPGDQSHVYRKWKGDGCLQLNDTLVHTVNIEVGDALGNLAVLKFLIQYSEGLVANTVRSGNEYFIPNKVNVINKPGFEAYLSKTDLYDTVRSLYFRSESVSPFALSGNHHLNDPSVPLHDDIIVRIKPDKMVPADWQDKMVIQRTDQKGSNVRKAIWEEKWLSAKFGDFGNFQLLADTSAPYLPELGKGDTADLSPSTRIIFTPSDNLSGIKRFRAELDGQWLRFTNDKSRSWIYIFDDRCPFGVHELKVTVEDLVGNSTTKSWWFKRYPYTPPPKKKAGKYKTKIKKKATVIKKKKK